MLTTPSNLKIKNTCHFVENANGTTNKCNAVYTWTIIISANEYLVMQCFQTCFQCFFFGLNENISGRFPGLIRYDSEGESERWWCSRRHLIIKCAECMVPWRHGAARYVQCISAAVQPTAAISNLNNKQSCESWHLLTYLWNLCETWNK